MPAPTRLLTTGRETMFPNDAHSQPASLRTMPVAPIHVTGCTVQSVYPANGRGVVKRSAAALGKLNQDYFVVTPVCKKTPQAQAFNSENCPPATTNAPHASLRLPQRTNHPNTHCSGKQGTRPASAPIRPNTGVIVITPMCNKKPLAVSKGSADGADKDTADAVKALTAALEKSQMSLKEMSDVAALLEADLQAANAAAKVAAFKKEEDDAQALKCQQEAERKEAALLKELAVQDQRERDFQEEKAALEKRLTEAVNAKIGAAAAKTNIAREVKKLKEQLASRDTQLLAAKAECHSAKMNLSTKEAALVAALQTNEDVSKMLQDKQEKFARLKAIATMQVSKIHMLGREKAAAEERAALAAAEKSESERAAAEQLQGALQRSEDLPEALQKERDESARLKADQAISFSQTESMRQKLVAAEQSAAQAIRGNTLRERAAAQQLQDAHQELAAAREEIAHLKAAREDAEQRTASATQQAAAERTSMGAFLAPAEAAEAGSTTANIDIQVARAEVGTAQGRVRSLLTESIAKENAMRALQGRSMDPSAADAPLAPATPKVSTQSAPAPDAIPSVPATTEDATSAVSMPDICPSAPTTAGDSTQATSAPDSILSARATVAVTTDDVIPAACTSDVQPYWPATPEEDTSSAASEVPRDSPADASQGQPRGPALPRLPEEALTRSKAAQPFSLVKKIAAVSRGLVAIMAADVKGWQAIVQA